MSDETRERETERLLSALPAPLARAEFRSDLRARFLAGSASAPPVDVLPDERPHHAAGGARTGRNWKPWVALGAAAGVVAMLYFSKPAPRHWQVLPGSSAAVVRVNGDALPAAEAELIANALNDARSVSAEGGSLRLVFRDQYALELPAGARVDFASFGNTGGVDPYTLGSQGAALRVVTGPGFRGHELHVRLGAASLHVTGTAFAIDDCPDGVCVCGLEGRVAVQRKGTQELPLEAGKQCRFPKDGSPLTWGEAQAEHVAPVRALETAARERWRP
jgi:ferric-dicitrate binding protein FerR (iron transport regulator)